jgi:alpha-galactosidase
MFIGWCSWYHFFEFVSEKDLMNNILSMIDLKADNGMHGERLGFDLFQVDDGYQVLIYLVDCYATFSPFF